MIMIVVLLGVNNEKWYEVKSGPSSTASSICRANDEAGFEEREKIYEENRLDLIVQFRY